MQLEYPEDLKYLDTHEYVRIEGEIATIGVSAFAIDQLGDLVFVELPEVGDSIEAEERFGTIESVKAVSDLYSPVTGTVIEQNETTIDAPEAVQEDPYGAGWLIKVRIDNPDAELTGVMSATDYSALVEGEN